MSTEKWVVVFDTLCEGNQAVGDGEGNLWMYDTEAQALAEIQDDVNTGMTEDGDEWPMRLSEFQEGRKTIWYPTVDQGEAL